MSLMQLVLLFVWTVSLMALTTVLAMPCLARRWWRKSLPPPGPEESSSGTSGGGGSDGDAEAPTAAQESQPEAFHYVTSPVQEEEMREAYLLEALRPHTKSISFRDDAPNALPTADIPTTTSSSSGYLSQRSTPTLTAIGTSDIETGSYSSDDDYDYDDEESVGEVMVGLSAGDFTGGGHATAAEMTVPLGGAADPGPHYRAIPKSCAICLSSFKVNDSITWSSNPDCRHVFHHDCVLDWFKAAGSRQLRRRHRQRQRRSGSSDRVVIRGAADPAEWITSLPTACPCCRREFVRPPGKVDDAAAGESKATLDETPIEGEAASVREAGEDATVIDASPTSSSIESAEVSGV